MSTNSASKYDRGNLCTFLFGCIVFWLHFAMMVVGSLNVLDLSKINPEKNIEKIINGESAKKPTVSDVLGDTKCPMGNYVIYWMIVSGTIVCLLITIRALLQVSCDHAQ